MISYHNAPVPPREKKREAAKTFAYGFKSVDTNDFHRIANCATKCVWSPNVFRDGRRLEANWVLADWLVLDFDTGELTLDEAINRSFCDMQHIIGVTMSHQIGEPAIDKFRVMIPFERRIEDLALFRWQMELALKKYPADQLAKDGARFFYPCREIVSIQTEGYRWEIDTEVPEQPDYAVIMARNVKNATVPRRVIQLLNSEWPPLTKNTTCFRLGSQLGPYGFTPEEIVAMILESPNYIGKEITKNLEKEILNAVKSGIKSAWREMASLQQSAP